MRFFSRKSLTGHSRPSSVIVAACTALFFSAVASAAGFYGNQSDLKWKTAGTEHFQFMYPVEYSSHAAVVSAYAEAVYDTVVNRYKKKLPSRINATLNNALYSNGSAVPSENAINLWLTNWDFKVRSSHGWLSDVVTHEFSHLVSIESGSKIYPSLYGFQFSYSDYYNERTTTDFLSMIPFTLQPLWFAEGTAQYESARMGFDGWDTHRDMLLRVAALNDSLLPLEYMHDFSDNSLLAELGPYTQGFALVRYIVKHYGEDAVPKIWDDLSKPYRATLSAAIQNVLGLSEQELYDAWKKEITEEYKAQKDSLGELVEGTKMTTDAFWQDFPVVAGKHLYGVSNFGGPWFEGGVFKMPKTLDSLKDEKSEEDGIIIENFEGTIEITDYAKSGFKMKKPWLDKGIDVFETENGPILTYVSYQNRDRNGHAHFDIAVSDTNKNQATITYLADAIYPAFDKQGTTVAFVRREPYSTRFVLSKVPFQQDVKSVSTEEPIDIFVPDTSYRYYNIYSPKFSPDGNRIAFSFFDDVQRGVALIDADGKNFKILSNPQFDERDVEWISNDKIVFASNRNGIFNLIEKDLASGKETPLTNVVGGAFTPTFSDSTIFFTQYDVDGFSLYKLDYKNSVKDSIVTATRDSVLHIADTTWSKCPETTENAATAPATATTADASGTATAAPSTAATAPATAAAPSTATAAADSLAKPCTPTPVIANRDSIIKIEYQDTLKVETKKNIVLHGSLPAPIKKQLELIDREFAGAEKDYKPIPTVPLFVPILSFNENAPDLTVFGEGDLKVKLGLAAVLSDPLKKNTLQLGLLLELGKGIDYINGDGINPRQEKEFFASLENRSTPLDLGIAYSYANYTSKDTVRYEDVRAHGGDSIGTSHYATTLSSLIGSAGYSIFKSIDTLVVSAGFNWSNINLYEDDFLWEYQKGFTASATFGLYGDQEGEDGTGISGQGNGLTLSYLYMNSDLSRQGKFSESFIITESGGIKPRYRKFGIHEFDIGLYGSLQMPFTGARLAAGGKISSIFNWNTDAKEDTLDSYYYNPIFLEGYPYLRSSEDYTRAGTRTAMAELHYILPIFEDWRKSFWIFSTRDFYIDLFAQIGAAWNGKFIDTDKFTDHRFWDRSVGISFRMSNKLFYSVPVDITLTFARALSRIGEDDNLEGGWKPTPVKFPLPKNLSPTRVHFSLGMGFLNSWQ